MRYFVYSVKDDLVAFNKPFYLQDNGNADQVAIRGFKWNVKSGRFGETAIDCNLYKIGTYDDATGQHENYRFPEVLCTGKECLNIEISEDV